MTYPQEYSDRRGTSIIDRFSKDKRGIDNDKNNSLNKRVKLYVIFVRFNIMFV